MYPFDSVRVKLSFAGKSPAALLQSALFLKNQRPEPSSWSDPDTAGNTLLYNILRSQPVELSTLQGVVDLTTSSLGKAEYSELLALMGLHSFDEEAAELMTHSTSMIFMGGQTNARNLIHMKATKSHLTSDKQVVVSTEILEWCMYVMNSNGIYFVVEPKICLDTEKLPGVDFSITEDEMDATGVSRWGENGSQYW